MRRFSFAADAPLATTSGEREGTLNEREDCIATQDNVCNLAYLALLGNRHSPCKSWVCEMRCVCNSHVACLVFVFFAGRLAMPLVRHASSKTWILRHATFSFPRQRGEPFETSAEGKC